MDLNFNIDKNKVINKNITKLINHFYYFIIRIKFI